MARKDSEKQKDYTEENTSLLRKAIAAGTAAIFMTEEGVRSVVGDMRLPKDIVRYVTEQAAEGRSELFELLSQEVRRFLDRQFSSNDQVRSQEIAHSKSTTSSCWSFYYACESIK